MPRDILTELRLANIARNQIWDSKGRLTGALGSLFFSTEPEFISWFKEPQE